MRRSWIRRSTARRGRWAAGRRGWSVVAVGLASVLLSGCGVAQALRPVGSGPLAMPSPSYQVPPIGSCYDSDAYSIGGVVDATDLKPTTCTAAHVDELVYMGRFTGDAANLPAPPQADPPEQAAYAKCTTAADAYLGGDWHGAWVALRYFPPTASQWQGGTRFYRCDLLTVASLDGVLLERAGSVKGGLRGRALLARTCANLQLNGSTMADGVEDIRPSTCTDPHDVEYVGVYADDAVGYPSLAQWSKISKTACVAPIEAYLGLTPAQFQQRGGLGSQLWPPYSVDWNGGDHVATCWLLVWNNKKVRASMKGLGLRPLPY